MGIGKADLFVNLRNVRKYSKSKHMSISTM